MAALLRTRAPSAFLQRLSFTVGPRALSTSKVAHLPLKKADSSEASPATTSAKTSRKSTSKKPNTSSEPKLYSEPPKGKVSPYILFCGEKIALTQGPIVERIKAVSDQWNSLSAEEKQVWVTRAEEISSKRQEDFEAWEAQQSPEALQQYKKDKRHRYRLRAAQRAETLGTTGMKQRGTSAYMLFTQAYRANPTQFALPPVEHSGKSATVTTAIALGQLWRSMTLGEKAPYIAQAEEDAKKVKQALANHLAEKLQQSKTA
ncbi:hypothetical protein FRC01_004792 [Tulasnella sp. 417]|nr:hypothetical protein FRC01_004792 [Tulasnella sp. 417]